MMELLLVSEFLSCTDGRLRYDGSVGPGTTGYCFHVGTIVPDAHSSSFHLSFATEGACVLDVLTFSIFFIIFLRETL